LPASWYETVGRVAACSRAMPAQGTASGGRRPSPDEAFGRAPSGRTPRALGYESRVIEPELPWARPLGATPAGDGRTLFRVWAPRARAVAVEAGGRLAPLDDAGLGTFEGLAPAAGGERYRYVLDDAATWPDPCSRDQPDGLRGASAVVDPAAFAWSYAGWQGLDREELVVYELHVGTFTPEGTFDAVVPRLAALRELGVTAIELMPVATFPGTRGWGYDGLYTWAPHAAYGGPAGLARLVDAAHAAGLGVLLDVVYNHVGPGAEALEAFGPYFTDRYGTFWGRAINYDDADSGAVREWAIQNACMWLRDYHLDGLRLDAVHAIYDMGARHVLAELAERARAVRPGALLIAESGLNDPRVIRPPAAGGWDLDAQWADDFHHALHTLLTGERDGYYADFGRTSDLAATYRRPYLRPGGYSPYRRRRHGAPADDRPPGQFVVCAQNHDQVGNRALGDRLPDHALRLAAFATILSPFTPLLFMGEEYGERRPFLYFTDHDDPAIARATREGRRHEFAAFAGFAGEVPDPQDPETFARSVLRPEAGDPALRALYAELLVLRRRLGRAEARALAVDEERRTLRVGRGDLELCMNLSPRPAGIATDRDRAVLATAPVEIGRGLVALPAWAGAALA